MPTSRDQLTAAAFAGGLILLIGAIAFWQAGQTVRAEQAALAGRAEATAAALADGIVVGSDDPSALNRRFEAVGTSEDGTAAITLLVPGDEPGRLRIVADWAADRAPQPPGVTVDATRSPKLARGLNELSVSTDTGIEAYAPVQGNGAGGAVIAVRIDSAVLVDVRRRAFVSATAIAGIAAVGVAVLAWLLMLPRTVERRSTSEPPPNDALGSVRRLDHLARGMHERQYVKQTFGRYVSQRVADVLAAEHLALGAPSEARDVTLLTGELDVGPLAENAAPDEVLTLLNEWMGAVSDSVDAQGGMMLYQHGDGFVAVFGAPAAQADHAARGVRATQMLRRRFADLKRDWEKNGRAKAWARTGKTPAARLGVHSGRVVVGNVGTPLRVRYGAVGPAVEQAAAVEHKAGELGTDVLISDTVLKQLPAGFVTTEDRGSVGDLRVFSVA